MYSFRKLQKRSVCSTRNKRDDTKGNGFYLIFHFADAGNDQTHVTSRPFNEVVDAASVETSVRIRQSKVSHGCHGYPVPNFYWTDLDGLKELIEIRHFKKPPFILFYE
jgi:hypothetical protein